MGGFDAKILPSGSFRRWLTRKITETFIKDVSAYFYDEGVRERVQSRFESLVVPGGGPYVIVSHSLGTVIAYDVLSQLGDDVDVVLFVTLGSPLGIAEVKDHIEKPHKIPAGVNAWKNFADRLDPVALDPGLGNEFKPGNFIADDLIINLHTRRLRGFNPHSSLGYLGHPHVRDAVHALVPPESISRTRRFVIAKDLADEMAGESDRMPVLIEVMDRDKDSVNRARETIIQEIEELTEGASELEVELHELRRYVAANLTAYEISVLESRHAELAIARLWRNSSKQILMNVSTHCVQAYTAQVGYKATGKGIAWAVLDTGIDAAHPHFETHNNIAEQWDCTQRGREPVPGGDDDHGHGTHVAGIIAGREKLPLDKPRDNPEPYVGMAPEANLHSYKVLKDNGNGRDAYINKALDHIASINEAATDLVIHGVNLSLGGPFNVEVFGCGHSPICEELRRLWRMGVIVCVAAGNEGFAVINTQGGPAQLNLDLSIGDPANLEECIAVGSVHKEQPRFYGVSYFSSRGPTADGRAKPDVVAPGERIISCKRGGSDYEALSGTSMACPHVSGIIAGFLTVRREYIGRPDEVKRCLLEHAEDLHRDRYHQGAGMPNLIKMLAGGLPQV
jgi:hypothetical protein